MSDSDGAGDAGDLPPKRRKKYWIVAGAAAVLLLVVVCSLGRRPPAQEAPRTVEVVFGTVERRIEVDGKISPASTYSLAFPLSRSDVDVGPNIAEIGVKVGDRVAADEILARLEGDSVEAAWIRAPVDGVIVEVRGAAGAPPPPGATIVMRSATLKGEFQIGETDLAALSVGTEATVTVPVLARAFPTTITTLPQDPVGATGSAVSGVGAVPTALAGSAGPSYALLVDLPQSDDLRPGLTARLTTTPQRREGVLVVPSAAIGGDPARPTVDVAVGDEVVTRPVTTGLNDGRNVEITSGLSAGEVIRVYQFTPVQ